MDALGTLFSLNNFPGHLSYVLIAISYWLTDMFWLRLVAVVGLSFEILYFSFSGGDLRTGIGWDLVFIGINAYQLYRLVQDRLSLRLPEADRELLRSVLIGSTMPRSRGSCLPVSSVKSPRAPHWRKRIRRSKDFISFVMAALESRSAVAHFSLGKRQLRRRSRVPDGQTRHGDGDCREPGAGARLRQKQAQSVLPQ